jgi:hypothetical protein
VAWAAIGGCATAGVAACEGATEVGSLCGWAGRGGVDWRSRWRRSWLAVSHMCRHWFNLVHNSI